MAENLADLPSLKQGQEVIVPIESPIKPSGHIQILYGNLAPEGSVAKITGKEGLYFQGPARVFDSEEDMLAALSADTDSFKASHSAHQGALRSAVRSLEALGGALVLDGHFDKPMHHQVLLSSMRAEEQPCYA